MALKRTTKKAAKKKSAKKPTKKKTAKKAAGSKKKAAVKKKAAKKKSAVTKKKAVKKKVVKKKAASKSKSKAKVKAKKAVSKKSSSKKIKVKKKAVKKKATNKKATNKKAVSKKPKVKKSANKKASSKKSSNKKSKKASAKKEDYSSEKATKKRIARSRAGGKRLSLKAAVKGVRAAVKKQKNAVAQGKIYEGIKAPSFSLKDRNGDVHKLSEISSDYVVVYFYPRDDTPGCTRQSKGFSRDVEKFRKLNTSLIGISGGDEDSKDRFCKKHNLKVRLLADPDFKVSDKYDAYGEKTFMGRKYMGIFRKTFVLDKSKKVIKIYDSVKPDEHSKEVREFIKGLQG